MAATAPSSPSSTPPPPSKLRSVLDYTPCEACLQEPDPEQELLCSICARVDREVAVKRVTERKVILVRPPAPIPTDAADAEEEIAPAGASEAEDENGPVAVVPHEAETEVAPEQEPETAPTPAAEPETAPTPAAEPETAPAEEQVQEAAPEPEPEPALPLPEVSVPDAPAYRAPDAVHVLALAEMKRLLGPRAVPKDATLVVVEEIPDPDAPAPVAVPAPEAEPAPAPEPEADAAPEAPVDEELAAEAEPVTETESVVEDEADAALAAETLVHEEEDAAAPHEEEEAPLAYAPAEAEVAIEPEPAVEETVEPEPEAAPPVEEVVEPEPAEAPAPEPEPLVEEEDEDDDFEVDFGRVGGDDVGFGFADAAPADEAVAEEEEDDDDFDVGFTFRPDEDARAEPASRPGPGALYDESEELPEDGDFTFRPPAAEEDEADADAPAETVDEEETTFEPEPAPAEAEVEDDRSPWARPMEDDWLGADEPAAPAEDATSAEDVAEEPWPDQEPVAAPPAPEEDEEVLDMEILDMEVVEDEAPFPDEVPEAPAEAEPEAPAEAEPEAPVEEDEEILDMEILDMEVVEDEPEPVDEVAEDPWPEDSQPQPQPAQAPEGASALSVTALPGATDADAQRLQEASVHEARDLLGRDPWQVADLTGLSGKRVEKWIWSAEMALIAGVPVEYADVLIKSGVKGLDALRNVDPQTAADGVNGVISEDAECDLAPLTADDVNAWKRQA